jgi:hypothetical protein
MCMYSKSVPVASYRVNTASVGSMTSLILFYTHLIKRSEKENC